MDQITGFLEDLDFAKLLPEIGRFLSDLRFWIWVLMALGPLVLLVKGLLYYYRPVQQPDEKRGYQLNIAMDSVKVWRFTQRTAAVVYMVMGGVMTGVSLVLSLIGLAFSELTLATLAVIWLIAEVVLVVLSRSAIRRKVAAKYN